MNGAQQAPFVARRGPPITRHDCPSSSSSRPRHSRLAERLRAGDRAALARAITLVESRKPEHQQQARELVQLLLPLTGRAMRVGITGVPGVGKSTTIDTLGANLVAAGHKVAVLAVDPSSARTGGSILGDKTRMERLAVERNAFIRPSPSGGTLGGVAAKTRETMLLCEAAGFDVILVETVGVGQSETTVAEMIDFFLVLMLPGAGDELQGIKKGVLELADMIAVNKSEGENRARAVRAAGEYRAALHIMQPASPNWSPPVVLVSGLENAGLDDMWAKVVEHRQRFEATGELAQKAPRPAGQMDVDHAGGAAVLAAALRRAGARAAARSGAPGRGRARCRRLWRSRKSRRRSGYEPCASRCSSPVSAPFPASGVNPAEIVVATAGKAKAVFALAGIDLHTAVLPVESPALSPTLSQLFARTSPDAVLLLGVAGRRRRLTIETLARNRVSILKPDAAKQRAYCRFIVHGGPDVLRSSAVRARASPPWRAATACRPRCRTTPAIICATKASIFRC